LTLTATHALALPCTPPPPPAITLTKQLAGALGSTAPPSSPPGRDVIYLLTLDATNISTAIPAAIEDALPGSLVIDQISASRGVASGNGAQTLRWVGTLSASLAPPRIWVRARLRNLEDCGAPLTNIGRWAARTPDGTVIGGANTPLTFTPACVAPTATPTAQPTLTRTPRATNTPVPAPTYTPVPLPTDASPGAPTNTPVPRATYTSVPLPTVTPRATNTPIPRATNTSVPLPEDAPPNAATNTPVPVATNTSVPLIPNAEELPLPMWLPVVSR
jgi:hypothetical protein